MNKSQFYKSRSNYTVILVCSRKRKRLLSSPPPFFLDWLAFPFFLFKKIYTTTALRNHTCSIKSGSSSFLVSDPESVRWGVHDRALEMGQEDNIIFLGESWNPGWMRFGRGDFWDLKSWLLNISLEKFSSLVLPGVTEHSWRKGLCKIVSCCKGGSWGPLRGDLSRVTQWVRTKPRTSSQTHRCPWQACLSFSTPAVPGGHGCNSGQRLWLAQFLTSPKMKSNGKHSALPSAV